MRLRALVFSILALALAICAPAQAQNKWSYDHVHLLATDPQLGLDWYIKNMDGKPCDDEGVVVPREKASRVLIGDMMFLFIKNDMPKPSAGSVADSVGISFADVAGKVKALEAAGTKVVNPVRDIANVWKRALVEDPWGTRLELIQDPANLGFHHVALRVADPEATMKWYMDAFGGTKGKMKGFDGVQYGKMWVLVTKAAEATQPSQGHAIDHLGFRPTSMDAAAPELKAKGVKFTIEPRTNPSNGHKIAYVEDPNGTRIELVQH